jgi:hypothetical protein
MKEIHIAIEPDFTDCKNGKKPHAWERADHKQYGYGAFICSECGCLDWFENEDRDQFEAFDPWHEE